MLLEALLAAIVSDVMSFISLQDTFLNLTFMNVTLNPIQLQPGQATCLKGIPTYYIKNRDLILHIGQWELTEHVYH